MEPSLSNSFAQATPSRAITKGRIFCTLRSLNTNYNSNRPNNQIRSSIPYDIFLLTQGLYAKFMQLICFYVKKFHIIQECESSNFIILYIYIACSHFFTCFFM